MKPTVSARKNSSSSAVSKSKADGGGRLRAPRYVLCIRNDGYPASLERHKVYRILRDADGVRHRLLRVIDESGEDYLYPRDYFIPIALPKAAQKILASAS